MEVIGELDPIPWYKTRIFWGVVIGILVLVSFIFFYLLTNNVSSFSVLSLKQIYTFFVFSTGGALFSQFGSMLFDEAGKLISTILFYLLILYSLYKTFNRRHVQLLYPILVLLLYVTGMITAALYSSSGL